MIIKNKYFFVTMIFCFLTLSAYGGFKVQHESSKNATNNMWMFELFNKNPKSIVFQLFGLYQNKSYPLILKTIGSGGKTRVIIYGPALREYSLSVWIGGVKIQQSIEFVQSFQKLDDTVKPIFLSQLDDDQKKLLQSSLNDDKIKNPTVKVKINNPTNKTMYLTFGQDNKIRPQTGTLKGWSGKTDSGLDLKRNIKLEEIGY